jgi:hypothetical protein
MLIVVVGVMLQACGATPVQPAEPIVPVGEPAVAKESHMQSPTDPKNPQRTNPPIPETVGATIKPFELGKSPTTISFEIHPPTGPALLRSDGRPKRMLLRVENMTSTTVAPPFDIYFNLPPGEDGEKHPELYALTLSTFGLPESSIPHDQHPGDGLSFIQDVTQLFMYLAEKTEWDQKTLRLSFFPAPWSDDFHVQVSRVSLIME